MNKTLILQKEKNNYKFEKRASHWRSNSLKKHVTVRNYTCFFQRSPRETCTHFPTATCLHGLFSKIRVSSSPLYTPHHLENTPLQTPNNNPSTHPEFVINSSQVPSSSMALRATVSNHHPVNSYFLLNNENWNHFSEFEPFLYLIVFK